MNSRAAGLVFLAFLALPPAASAREDSATAVGVPETHVKTIPASAFVPVNAFTVNNMGVSLSGDGTVCNDYVGGTCRFSAGIDLPSGARIVGIDVEACDNTNFGQVELVAKACPVGAACAIMASLYTINSPGCVTSVNFAHTVENAGEYYPLFIAISDGTISIAFRAVRIRYQLQVSAPPPTASFNDVPDGYPNRDAIEALYAAGITQGCGANNFCPDNPVTRAQLAVFLARALGLHWGN